MFDLQELISDRAHNIDASGIRKVFDLAASLENPINLSIGQPDFPVPDAVKQATIDAIETNHNAYTQTQGIAPLRERLMGDFKARFSHEGRWQDPGMIIASGVSGALLLALLSTVETGDEVLIPDPYFVMYKHLVTMAGGESVYIDTYPDFQITAERLEPAITEKTKVLMMSSPANPTGVVTTPDNFKDIVALCEKHNILLISDEIYDIFCYEKVDTPAGKQAPSPADYSDQILVLRGFSKSYAMTGWRMAYAIGPQSILEPMTRLQQFTFVCAPSMAQHGALVALDQDMQPFVDDYQKKRDLVIEKLSDTFDLTTPGGAFYAFPKVPGGSCGMDFATKAIENNVLIVPGSVFSEKDTHFRISYACPDEKLAEGLDILCDIARSI